jgi:hypothetical protein
VDIILPQYPMAFAEDIYAPHGTFNNVGGNQYNCIVQLEPAFLAASAISSIVQQTEASQEQLQILSTSIDTLLKTLDSEYRSGQLLKTATSFALENLTKYVYQGFMHETSLIKALTFI